jgi:toxin ParE1/3/4
MAVWRLARSARADIVDVLACTEVTFGPIARLRYERLLATAIRDIADDAQRAGTLARPEIGEDVCSHHLRYSRERARTEHGTVARPRHFLLYRIVRADLIGIGRVLHDAMEIERHSPPDYGAP